MSNKHYAGYTLIEVMITVVIIGILAAIAWPLFEAQSKRSQRTDAAKGLTIAVIELERCLSDTGAYCNYSATSPDGYYAITAATTSDTFYLTATPVAPDADCTTLTLNHFGEKGYTGAATNIKRCWAQ